MTENGFNGYSCPALHKMYQTDDLGQFAQARPTIRKLAEAVWVKHFLACSRGVFESRSTFLTQFVASKTVYLFDLVVVDVFDIFSIC